MSKIDEIRELIMKGKGKQIAAAVEEAVKAGEDPNKLLNEGMIGAMDEIGAKFTEGKIFVPEMLVSAKAMKKGVEALKPHLSSDAAAGLGTVVIGTVLGDLHDIGKNLVAMMLEALALKLSIWALTFPQKNIWKQLKLTLTQRLSAAPLC